jgi:hypothetical protein
MRTASAKGRAYRVLMTQSGMRSGSSAKQGSCGGMAHDRMLCRIHRRVEQHAGVAACRRACTCLGEFACLAVYARGRAGVSRACMVAWKSSFWPIICGRTGGRADMAAAGGMEGYQGRPRQPGSAAAPARAAPQELVEARPDKPFTLTPFALKPSPQRSKQRRHSHSHSHAGGTWFAVRRHSPGLAPRTRPVSRAPLAWRYVKGSMLILYVLSSYSLLRKPREAPAPPPPAADGAASPAPAPTMSS